MQLHHSADRLSSLQTHDPGDRPSDAVWVPCILVTSVLPIFLIANIAGALTSHHTTPIFLRKRIEHLLPGSLLRRDYSYFKSG